MIGLGVLLPCRDCGAMRPALGLDRNGRCGCVERRKAPKGDEK